METVENLKMQIEEMKKQRLRRARVTSLILAGAFVVAVLFMVYGLTQEIEATRNLEQANMNEKNALEAKLMADRQRDIANEQTALALLKQRELEAVVKGFEDCCKKK
jgi:hypothetical protein